MGRLTSLIFYIVIFAISSCFVAIAVKSKDKYKKILLLVIGLIMPILVGGLRYNVGTDYFGYEYMYILNPWKVKNIEIGMRIILIISQFLKNPQVIFQIYAILTIVFAYMALKKNSAKYRIGKCFFFYLILQYTVSFNIMRQILAVTIVLYASNYIFERNIKKYTIFMIIACVFHTTAIFFYPMYFIVSKKQNEKMNYKQVLMIILLIVVILNYNNIMNLLIKFKVFSKYENYTENIKSGNLTAILFSIFAIIFICLKKRLSKLNSKNNIYIIFYIIATILMFSGYISPYIKRIANYFSIFEIYLLEELPKLFKNNKQKLIIDLAMVLYVITRFILAAYVLKQGDIIPYYSIFSKEIF